MFNRIAFRLFSKFFGVNVPDLNKREFYILFNISYICNFIWYISFTYIRWFTLFCFFVDFNIIFYLRYLIFFIFDFLLKNLKCRKTRNTIWFFFFIFIFNLDKIIKNMIIIYYQLIYFNINNMFYFHFI